jgi:hypothetical protein
MTTQAEFRFGFRVVGNLCNPRRLTDAGAAFLGHCRAIPEAELNRESYLSAFTFGLDFSDYMNRTATPKGFCGSTGAPYLLFDIDREGRLDEAARDACKLAMFLDDRYPEISEPLAFFSGSKGFHISLPLAHRPSGGPMFHRAARKLAEALAARRGVTIDTAIYDRVHCFRAPNSRHPKTGLHKVRVELDCLMHRDADAFRVWAREPKPFDPPAFPTGCPQMAADWVDAERAVAAEVRSKPISEATPGARLQHATMDLLRNGCPVGERHVRLFRAAGNMVECGGTPPFIHAILDEIGSDLGLSPTDARRQVDCGIERAVRQRELVNAADEGGSA